MAPSARRCSDCSLDWPNDFGLYGECPGCEGPTSVIAGCEPLDADVARSLKSHYDFERYYEKRQMTLPSA